MFDKIRVNIDKVENGTFVFVFPEIILILRQQQRADKALKYLTFKII